jgi:hypothetical protein
MKKYAIMVLVLIATASSALAQDNITAITYQVSKPLGDFENFIDEVSSGASKAGVTGLRRRS